MKLHFALESAENLPKHDQDLDDHIEGYLFKSVVDEGHETKDRQVFYGKIVGKIAFAPFVDNEKKTGFVKFTYYLNPNSNDRNIEFDPQRNLFKDAEKTYPP